MSEENIVTYADVVRFYADKDDTDEVADTNDGYGTVAYCVWFARAYKGICFPEYRIKVNEDIGSKSGERIIIEGPSDDRSRDYWRSFEWENIRYDVHHSADDYVFAWLVVNKIKKDDYDWITTFLYNKNKGDKCQDFDEWFINRCNPIKGEFYKPGQKWHLFEYILYKEMNYVYRFSKITSVNDLIKDPFVYYQNAGGNGCKCPEFMLWMAEEAGVGPEKIEKAKGKVEEKKGNGESNNNICASLKEGKEWSIPWTEVSNNIKKN